MLLKDYLNIKQYKPAHSHATVFVFSSSCVTTDEIFMKASSDLSTSPCRDCSKIHSSLTNLFVPQVFETSIVISETTTIRSRIKLPRTLIDYIIFATIYLLLDAAKWLLIFSRLYSAILLEKEIGGIHLHWQAAEKERNKFPFHTIHKGPSVPMWRSARFHSSTLRLSYDVWIFLNK